MATIIPPSTMKVNRRPKRKLGTPPYSRITADVRQVERALDLVKHGFWRDYPDGSADVFNADTSGEYHVTEGGCTCPANKPCKHMTALRIRLTGCAPVVRYEVWAEDYAGKTLHLRSCGSDESEAILRAEEAAAMTKVWRRVWTEPRIEGEVSV